MTSRVMVINIPPVHCCLTCPGCTVRSTPSWLSGKSLCSHVGPDNQGPATVAGRPAGPAPDSEPSCSAGSERWWRPTPPLETREMQKQWFVACMTILICFCWSQHKSVYLYWRCYMCYTWCQGVHVQRNHSCLYHPCPLSHNLVTPTLNM